MSPARTNRSSIPGGRGPTGLVFDITVDGPAVEAMAPQIPMSAKGFSDRPTARHRAPSRRLLARHELANLPGGHYAEEDAEPGQDHRLAEGPRDLDARQSRQDEEGGDEQDAGDGDGDDDGHPG